MPRMPAQVNRLERPGIHETVRPPTNSGARGRASLDTGAVMRYKENAAYGWDERGGAERNGDNPAPPDGMRDRLE